MSASASSNQIIPVGQTEKQIPYKHSLYWEWILDLEARYALRVFELERAQERKECQIFGDGARAIVRSSPYFPEAATLWVDGKIRETFRGDKCWTQALQEANRINEFFKTQSAEIKALSPKPGDVIDLGDCSTSC